MKTTIGQEIIEGLGELAKALKKRGTLSDEFNCRKVVLHLKPTAYKPELVKATRRLLGASQAIFAHFLGVSPRTVRAWEQGVNVPNDMACRFMDEIRHRPQYWLQRLKEMTQAKDNKGRTRTCRR